MKQIVALAAAALLAIGAVSVYLIFKTEPTPKPIPPVAPTSELEKQAEPEPDAAKELESLLKQGSGSVVVLDGKTAAAAPGLSMPTTEGVSTTNSVSINEGKASVSASIVLNKETPVVVSKDAFEKIELGMTYEQIASVVGGVLQTAALVKDYTGGLTISQGTRSIQLGFENGKLAVKSSRGF